MHHRAGIFRYIIISYFLIWFSPLAQELPPDHNQDTNSATQDSLNLKPVQPPINKNHFITDSTKITPSVIINNGDEYTRTPDVHLTIYAPEAIAFKVSNDVDFSELDWLPMTNSLNWKFPPGDGYKKVFLKFLQSDSSISSIFYDEIILDLTPPVAAFSITPDSGIAGETLFIFDATESRHNFDLSFRWDWENDGTFDVNWTSSKQETYKYIEGGGKKVVKLEVKDAGGWLVFTTREIFANTRPQPKFDYSQDFQNPLSITFDAYASSDFEDDKNLQVRWNFDADSLWDSDWSFIKKVTHTFEDFDKQTIWLEVKDAQGLTKATSREIQNAYYNMTFIPAGEFIMGSDQFELDELPIHTVFVDGFWIDKYPITNKRYADFLNAQHNLEVDKFIDLSNPDNKIHFVDSIYVVESGFEDHPVTHVSWYGAQAYAQFYQKSLPTEAQWEKAARGLDGLLYPWGNELNNAQANYWDSGDPFDNNTTPIGFFNGRNFNGFQTIDSPSPYGIYDLVDNVREWCADWYQRDYYSNSPQANPNGPTSGIKKVVRGGGYLFHNELLRTTFRSSYEPAFSSNYIGFRCVKVK